MANPIFFPQQQPQPLVAPEASPLQQSVQNFFQPQDPNSVGGVLHQLNAYAQAVNGNPDLLKALEEQRKLSLQFGSLANEAGQYDQGVQKRFLQAVQSKDLKGAQKVLKDSKSLKSFEETLPTLFPGIAPDQQESLKKLAQANGVDAALTQARALESGERARQSAARAEAKYQKYLEAQTESRRRFELGELDRAINDIEKHSNISAVAARSQFILEQLPKVLKVGATPKSVVAQIAEGMEKKFGADKEFRRLLQNDIDEIFEQVGAETGFFRSNQIPEGFDTKKIVDALKANFNTPEMVEELRQAQLRQQDLDLLKASRNQLSNPQVGQQARQALQRLRDPEAYKNIKQAPPPPPPTPEQAAAELRRRAKAAQQPAKPR